MAKKIGLEIGNRKTKLVVGQKHKNKFNMLGYEIIDTLDGVFTIDGDIDILRMEAPLIDALDRLNVKKGDLYISINNEKVIIRTRELPRVSPKEMMEIVQFEAESFLPYDISAFYIDFKVIEEVEKEDGKTLFNVMIIAAPMELVNQYVVLAKSLNLKLKLATAYTEVITKFMKQNLLNENMNILFVDLGHKYTNMTMFEGLQYFANIKTEKGVNGIYESLLDNYGFTESDVNHYMFSYKQTPEKHNFQIPKLGPSNGNHTVKDLQKRLQEIVTYNQTPAREEDEVLIERNRQYKYLINEIARMVDFFKTRKYGTYVDIIYIFGGGSNLSEFVSIAEEQLSIKCSKLPVESFDTPLSHKEFDLMLPAIGACLGGK